MIQPEPALVLTGEDLEDVKRTVAPLIRQQEPVFYEKLMAATKVVGIRSYLSVQGADFEVLGRDWFIR